MEEQLEIALGMINFYISKNKGANKKFNDAFKNNQKFFSQVGLNIDDYFSGEDFYLPNLALDLFHNKYNNEELNFTDYKKFIACLEVAYFEAGGNKFSKTNKETLRNQQKEFLSQQDIPHNHGHSIIGYDPSFEANERLKLKQLAKSAVGFSDVQHHLEEGLLDPSNTHLVYDANSQKWLPTNFGHGQTKNNNHSHDQYLPHITTNMFGLNNAEITDENGNKKPSTNAFLSMNRMSNNGFNYMVSSNLMFEKSADNPNNPLGARVNNTIFRGYKPVKQDEDGFLGIDAVVSYNNFDHELTENRPIYLPHNHNFSIFESQSLETYLGTKRTDANFTYGLGVSYLMRGEKNLFGVKSETSFRIPSLAGLGFFTTTALYSEKANFSGGYGCSHFGLGINFEQHGKISFFNPLAHIKFSRNETLNEGVLEKNINAELTYNAPINRFLSLSVNANLEKSEEETHQLLNSFIQFTPARKFFLQAGYDASKRLENLEGGEQEISKAGNVFIGAGVIHNALNVTARVNLPSGDAPHNTTYSNQPVVSLNASYNFNLTAKKKVKS